MPLYPVRPPQPPHLLSRSGGLWDYATHLKDTVTKDALDPPVSATKMAKLKSHKKYPIGPSQRPVGVGVYAARTCVPPHLGDGFTCLWQKGNLHPALWRLLAPEKKVEVLTENRIDQTQHSSSCFLKKPPQFPRSPLQRCPSDVCVQETRSPLLHPWPCRGCLLMTTAVHGQPPIPALALTSARGHTLRAGLHLDHPIPEEGERASQGLGTVSKPQR